MVDLVGVVGAILSVVLVGVAGAILSVVLVSWKIVEVEVAGSRKDNDCLDV